MILVLVIAAAVIFILAVFRWCVDFCYYLNYLAPFPGPRPIPLIGNYHNLGSEEKYLSSLFELTKTYGRVVRMMIGNQPRLILSDSKGVEFLLSSQFIIGKPEEYSFFHSWLGRGLLTSSGNRWRVQRQTLVNSFHFQILERYIPIYYDQCNIMISALQKRLDLGAFDICPFIDLCTLDIIYETGTGLSLDAQKEEKLDYVRSVNCMWKVLVNRVSSILKMKYYFFKQFNDYNTQRTALTTLYTTSFRLIEKRRKEILVSKAKPPSLEELYLAKHKYPFLDSLLWSRNSDEPLCNYIIREELDTFLFKGHRPVAAAVSFTLYMLSKHKHIQNQVIDEMKKLFGQNMDRPPSFLELQRMVYLEMVVRETMRLYPPIPQFSRTLEQDLEFEGKIVPKGLAMVVFTAALHRHPEEFPNPDVFDPERFTPENNNKRSPYSYVPFSGGPRSCIGHRFAMLEIKTIISTILKKFELVPCVLHTPKLLGHIVLRSKNGLFVGLRKRYF